MKRIGLTTTVPVEAIYGSGCVPVDLNNLLINSSDPRSLIESAEVRGWPRSLCSWVKGIFTAVCSYPEIDAVVAVTQGDCSNIQALMEMLEMSGVRVIDFSYPFDRNSSSLKAQIEKILDSLGGGWRATNDWKERLDKVRSLVWRLDELTWSGSRSVRGFENHLYQVMCSDFGGDPEAYEGKIECLLQEVEGRASGGHEGGRPRLAFIGVPPIIPQIYDFIESLGAKVVFNEVQRQFTMPFRTDDIVEQYLAFTYPYHISHRIEDIKREIALRRVDGVIHYVQSFCFRQIEDLIFRKTIDVPLLTIETDMPGDIEGGVKMRVENFVEMLR